MNLFETLLLDTILILFPIICYFIYLFFQKTLSNKRNDIFFDFALFSSIYLLMKYGIDSYHEIPLILFDVPIVIAYLKNRKLTILILSLIAILYYNKIFNINIYFLTIEYFIYFIIYIFRNKKDNYIDIYVMIKMIVFYSYTKIYSDARLFDMIVLTLFFYIMTKLIINLFNKTKQILSIYKTMEKIEEDKKTKDSLFKITHEIKNPIAVCKGYLDMFNVDNVEHSKKYIPIIKEEIDRVLILLNDFLCITRITINKEEMDLSILLEDIKNNFDLILKGKNIEMSYKEINDTYMYADYNRLKQVLVNIIKNSMEAIEGNGNIKLYTIRSKNRIKIIIEDNGIGMTKEELNQITNAFFTTKKNGTGLGIYLSNEIIEKHNGTLKYKSEKGIGTKVIISLPI